MKYVVMIHCEDMVDALHQVSWKLDSEYLTLKEALKRAYKIAGKDCETMPSTDDKLKKGYFGAKGHSYWDVKIEIHE